MVPEFQYNHLLKADGTNQNQRKLPALDPAFAQVDERSMSDLLEFTYHFAHEVRYYDSNNLDSGDWQIFFKHFIDPVSGGIKDEELFLREVSSRSDFTPHFALFLCFLKLFRFAQDDINTITKRHLDYYYERVLSLAPKPAQPDTVHVLFELAKNVKPTLVEPATLLNAGKDDNGNPLVYSTEHEIVVNHARVAELKSVFVDKIDGQSRIYMAPVANSADGLGKPLEGAEAKWNPFGESQKDKVEGGFTMVDAPIGFALTSPMLFLKEGDRTVTIAFRFHPVEGAVPQRKLKSALKGYLSGEKGWIEPEIIDATLDPLGGTPHVGVLTITLHLPADAPAVVTYLDKTFEEGFDAGWPMLKLHLDPEGYAYDILSRYTLAAVTIAVDVKEVRDLILQNDQGVLDPGKPFLPFGVQPAIGSSFYIGSTEVFQKRLRTLNLHLTWHEIPPFLWEHYAAYYDDDTVGNFNTLFRAKLNLLLKKGWDAELVNPLILFDSESADQPRSYNINESRINGATLNLNYTRNPYLEGERYDHTSKEGFIKLELTAPLTPFRAFGHKEFPAVYTAKAIELSKFDPASGGQPPVLPNAPYTPSISSFLIDYSSSEEIIMGSHGVEQVFSIGPFGYREITVSAAPYLLPEFREEGDFYIGLSDLTPPQNISLLMQLAEGSAQADIIPDPDELTWSYLVQDHWVPFDPLQVLMDTTLGLQRSGIVSFAVPREASVTHTMMPSGKCWLKASIPDGAAGISKMIAVEAQAMSASFVLEAGGDTEKFTQHLNNGLPELRINGLLRKNAVIKSVRQPYSSTGGRGKEGRDPFYVRVSERLRHKNRALTLWDYERLVLETFPSIFKVKCLNHTNTTSEAAPGYITLIVVSNLRNKNGVNPLEPKTSISTLADIKTYVQSIAPSYLRQDDERVQVENPVYERLLVDMKVGYREGKDPGFYGNLLNDEIKRFLSPWAYEEGRDIIFGGKIYKSDILAYVENRPYVDFVKDFELYHIHDGKSLFHKGIGKMTIGKDFIIKKPKSPGINGMTIGENFVIGEDVEVAIATTARSILVSHANHRIAEAISGTCDGTPDLGIGYMTVGIDFLVEESI